MVNLTGERDDYVAESAHPLDETRAGQAHPGFRNAIYVIVRQGSQVPPGFEI
jgi:hypothetical protein